MARVALDSFRELFGVGERTLLKFLIRLEAVNADDAARLENEYRERNDERQERIRIAKARVKAVDEGRAKAKREAERRRDPNSAYYTRNAEASSASLLNRTNRI